MCHAIHCCLLHCTEFHANPFQNMNQSRLQKLALFYLCKTNTLSKTRIKQMSCNVCNRVKKQKIAEKNLLQILKTDNNKGLYLSLNKFYLFFLFKSTNKSRQKKSIIFLIIKFDYLIFLECDRQHHQRKLSHAWVQTHLLYR